MVKNLFFIFALALSLFAQEATENEMLDEKIISFIGAETFEKNRDYIHIIFKDTESFYTKEQINVVQVVETLEENGLLHLFFDAPQQYEMTFHSTGSPLFFVKLMGDTLRSMGYYRYVTKESKNDASGFEWTISLEAGSRVAAKRAFDTGMRYYRYCTQLRNGLALQYRYVQCPSERGPACQWRDAEIQSSAICQMA